MSELFQVADYEVTVDQAQYPHLNYSEFQAVVDIELRKFVQLIMGLQSDFLSPQDVNGAGGVNCRFHNINGYPAVRQLTQYQPNSKTWFVWFDCRVLTRAPESIKPDGSVAAKLETPTLTEPSSNTAAQTEDDLRSEVMAKFNTVH